MPDWLAAIEESVSWQSYDVGMGAILDVPPFGTGLPCLPDRGEWHAHKKAAPTETTAGYGGWGEKKKKKARQKIRPKQKETREAAGRRKGLATCDHAACRGAEARAGTFARPAGR